MHTVSYEFLMKPEESAGCHQTLSLQVGAGHETNTSLECSLLWAHYWVKGVVIKGQYTELNLHPLLRRQTIWKEENGS